MSAQLSEVVFATFLVFCRIGGCLMVMPGFASERVSAQIRVLIAIGVTIVVAPLLLPGLTDVVRGATNSQNLKNIISELLTGAMIGVMGRYFFLALQFAASALAMFLSLGGLPQASVDSVDPSPAFANILMVTATLLFFVTDQHLEVIKALVASYTVLPVSDGFQVQPSLVQLAQTLSVAFLLGLQIISPFIVFSISMNFMFGLLNKLTPQIQVYFISIPFVAGGGLLFVYFFIDEVMDIFINGFATWLLKGL